MTKEKELIMFYQNKFTVHENTCAHENNTCAHENKCGYINDMNIVHIFGQAQ